ncbi:MAG: hypothetical protein Q8Q62_15555 [Mesorhizobium sp.]|nr:hypothetical protein [Mesorhizobium sp.]
MNMNDNDILAHPAGRPAKHRREPIRTTDEHRRDVVKVPLDEAGRHWATMDAEDFDRLHAAGLTGVFFLVNNGNGNLYVRAACRGVSGGQITVARAILGLGKGEIVCYRGSDRTDLRRRSIHSERGAAKRDDIGLARDRQDALIWVAA